MNNANIPKQRKILRKLLSPTLRLTPVSDNCSHHVTHKHSVEIKDTGFQVQRSHGLVSLYAQGLTVIQYIIKQRDNWQHHIIQDKGQRKGFLHLLLQNFLK